MDVYDYWLLSPVVGEIAYKHAAVLCEPRIKVTNLTYQISTNVGVIDEGIIHPAIDGPTRIILPFPADGSYTIKWFQHSIQIFQHTIIVTDSPTSMIFVSCDLLEADTDFEHSMWTRMRENINSKNQVCLFHNGDQAYMDKVFKRCVDLAHHNGHNEETSAEIIQEFGRRYYNTWMPHNTILANMSNYNLWDDHEIKNNLMLTDNNISEDEKYVRDLAVQAYNRYQESLHLTKHTIMSDYSWYKLMGSQNEILVLGIERTSRIIPVSEILQNIDTITYKTNIKRLILCFASAPIPAPHGRYGRAYRALTRDHGTPETSKFWDPTDLSDLYRGLFNWMSVNYGSEVLVVGGDLHFGTYGIARCQGKNIPVVISSPITNQPTTDRWLASKGMGGVHIISSDRDPITFITISSKARRCYAVVNLNSSQMEVTMEYSFRKLPRSPLKYAKTLIGFA